MKDGIIAGTGNSRYLKSAITATTTFEELRLMLIAGTLPIDLNGTNTAGWQQIGMAIAKATLFPDDTVTALELDPADDPMPKDGLEALMRRIKVNERVEFTSYVGTGGKGSANPNVLTFEHTPKLLIISQADNVHVSVIYLHAGTNTCATVAGTNIYRGGYCSFTVEGNTVSWYVLGGYWSGSGSGSSNDYNTAEYQLNESGVTYEVIAITQGWVSE